MMFTIKKIIYNKLQNSRKKSLKVCGQNVRIAKNCRIKGNVEIGSNVVIGEGARLVSTIASIKIHDYVVFGPDVTIYTGDHPTNIIGKHIIEITDAEKCRGTSLYDKDVIIEAGCWIGTGAIILKGVTIGRGSVIGAGAVVTKNVPAYSIYVGVPLAKCIPRFTDSEIREHEQILKERHVSIQ